MPTETFRYPRRFKAMTAVSGVVFATPASPLLEWLEIRGVERTGGVAWKRGGPPR